MKVENIAVRKIFLVNVIFLVLYTLRVHKITMKFLTVGGETLLDSAHGLMMKNERKTEKGPAPNTIRRAVDHYCSSNDGGKRTAELFGVARPTLTV